MTGKTHLFVGTTFAYAACLKANIDFCIAAAAYAAIGSLLPDIDEKRSTINKYVPLRLGKLIYGSVGAAMAYEVYKAGEVTYALPAILLLLIYFSGHRGFTHSFTACIMFSIAFIGDRSMMIPFAAGYFAHLVCDMTNTKGIPLFYPLKKRYKFPLNFSSGSALGKAIESGTIGVCVFYLISIIAQNK